MGKFNKGEHVTPVKPEWDGRTERRSNPSDHDNLTRVITLLGEHVKNFDTHVADDKRAFETMGNRLWNHAKFIYIGIGGVAILELIGFFHK